MENKKKEYDLIKIIGLLKYPLITEKTTGLFGKKTYTFLVDRYLKKDEIKYALEKLFNVKIIQINTMILSPKFKRVKTFLGRKSTYKKVMIKLREGDTIKGIFD